MAPLLPSTAVPFLLIFVLDAASGYLSDDVETLEDLQLPQFGSELVAFLELKTKWSILRQQLKVALCELFLLEHDPAFDLEAFHTWAELREQCARIWAMVPGCKRWYEH